MFLIRIEPDEDEGTPAFSVSCEFLNVYTFGDTDEEALTKIQGAIELPSNPRLRMANPSQLTQPKVHWNLTTRLSPSGYDTSQEHLYPRTSPGAEPGYLFECARGSHYVYRRPDRRKVTVPFHGEGSLIPRGRPKNIIEREAESSDDDLHRLGLLD